MITPRFAGDGVLASLWKRKGMQLGEKMSFGDLDCCSNTLHRLRHLIKTKARGIAHKIKVMGMCSSGQEHHSIMCECHKMRRYEAVESAL